ncbi:class I SAM-dependent methyltransferase [Kangiella sp.]|uniref:class I SAM-dependent methyltransferase n=1 Tax=Kangiella sp. TaxID=1920245 RepID=UPI0019C71EC8|nr:class I SAM-dependent methyltransferase [Kangiella sp.]MBD3654158.1 class I SAM-dependent methyltransferase [Kangiella sp.]
MDEFKLLVDLHKSHERQGPGAELETRKAIDLTGINATTRLKIADIGCGTGASSLILAKSLNAEITAVDFLEEFLVVLRERAKKESVSEKIKTLCCSMESLPFNDQEFDIIWSEGAIYNIGFKKGIKEWRQFLKPGGLLVASEITWTTARRPQEIQQHWESEYPEINTASAKIQQLEESDYSPIGYFTLPESCWLDNYYQPIEKSLEDFLKRHDNCERATEIAEAERQEIALYKKYKDYYSYGFYVARKLN